MKKAMKKAER